MPVTPHLPSYPKAVKSSTARRQYQRQQRTHRERFTPAQLRQIEREEAQLKKARQTEEREKKRKIAKKRKEEREVKEREERRRLVQEGKLDEEDTWGKCAASQQRLNVFFNGFQGIDNKKRKRDDPDAMGYRRASSTTSAPPDQPNTRSSEDPDLQHFSSSAPDIMTRSAAPESTASSPKSEVKVHTTKASNTVQSPSLEQKEQKPQAYDLSLPGSMHFKIHEDPYVAAQQLDHQCDSKQQQPFYPENADVAAKAAGSFDQQPQNIAANGYSEASVTNDSKRRQPSNKSEVTMPDPSDELISASPHRPNGATSPTKGLYSTPTKRVALGIMSQSHLNVRAAEKPNIATNIPPVSSLPSPGPSPSRADHPTTVADPSLEVNAQNAAQVLAMICSQDIGEGSDSENDEDEDKENKDPRKFPLMFAAGKADSEPMVKVSSSSPATMKADSQLSLRERGSASLNITAQYEEESETDYEDLFDSYENDKDDLAAALEDDHKPANHRLTKTSKDSFTNTASRLAATGSMKNTIVDVHGSPHKPKSTPPSKTTPMKPVPIPSILASADSAKSSPKPHHFQTPAKTTSPTSSLTAQTNKTLKTKSATPPRPKNEFSSFGLEGTGIDEEDLAMMASAFEEAEKISKRSGGNAKGKGELEAAM